MRAATGINKLFFGATLALVLASALTAEASTPEKFIKSAWSDGEVVEGQSSDYDPETAWSPFREVEVFTGTESGKDESTFETGMSFEMKSLRELKETWSAKSSQNGEFRRSIRLQQALQRRYLLLVEFFHSKKLLKHLEDHGEALDRNFRAQNLALRYGKSRAQDLLKAQVALSNSEREMREAKANHEAVKAQIKAILPDFKESSFSIRNFVTPEDIAGQKFLFRNASSSTTRRFLETELSQMKSEQSISLARQNAWVKGFKLSFEEKPKETIYKGAISFKLPFLGDDLVAIQSRSDKLAKVYEKERELQLMATLSSNEPGQLKTLLESYTQISRTLNSVARVERSIVDPQVALDTVLSVRAARSELLALEKEILIAYVNLLYEQSVLGSQADINHLSASRSRL